MTYIPISGTQVTSYETTEEYIEEVKRKMKEGFKITEFSKEYHSPYIAVQYGEEIEDYPIDGEFPALPPEILREVWKASKPVVLKMGKEPIITSTPKGLQSPKK